MCIFYKLFFLALFCISFNFAQASESNASIESRKNVRIQFKYMWKAFSPEQFIQKNLPLEGYDYEIVENDPEIVFFSVFHKPSHPIKKILHQVELQYRKKMRNQGRFLMPKLKGETATKVFITYENARVNMDACDYAFAFDYEEDVAHENYLRLPFFAVRNPEDIQKLIQRDQPADKIMNEDRKFCNFIYSNDNAGARKKFFEKLSKYKRVDSPGKSKNNMPRLGGSLEDKIAFQKEYKFSICFENTSYSGYTTEKIVDAMLTDSIPIYWGNPNVDRDFNANSFINYYDIEKEVKERFPKFLFSIPIIRSVCDWIVEELSLNRLVERVIEVDTDDNLYESMLNEKWVTSDQMLKSLNSDAPKAKFKHIIDSIVNRQ